MGKNKVIPQESKLKKDKFFKRINKSNQSQHNKSNAQDSQPSRGFFIKNKQDSTKSKPLENNKGNDRIKKPFDKKKWRLQRYSKKYKLQQWEETRKKAILKEFYKENKDNTSNFDVQTIYKEAEEEPSSLKPDELENENNLNSEIINDNSKSTVKELSQKKKKPYINAYQEYQRLKEEKIKRKEDIHRKKEERDKALKEYKKEKIRKFKKLNKKTTKGQPIMKYRMQMLLEQIQKSS